MTDGLFDSSIAPDYDASSTHMFDPTVLTPTVDVLADLAAGGSALEFAIGTGRVALPLSDRGVAVSGIELSQAMVAELKAKPGAEQIPITIGDMSTARVPGEFNLVYLVYNTITNLLTQDEQVACFCNAAAHLAPGGSFLVEVHVPPLQRLPIGETLRAFDVADGHFGVEEIDIVAQLTTSHHAWVDDGVGRTFASTHRYASPAEYDLMARIAGMTLSHRWANWQRDPFAVDSTTHISVWQKPTE